MQNEPGGNKTHYHQQKKMFYSKIEMGCQMSACYKPLSGPLRFNSDK